MNTHFSGIYDDDGNRINPGLIPVPGLCITCKNYEIDDWEQKLLCNLNRLDQRNAIDFKCDAYEKK